MVDVAVICAHPDDAELACAGTVKKLSNEGRSVAFIDCTRGELGSRGTAEIRELEASRARDILGVKERACLDMPDGSIMYTTENIRKIVVAIRTYRPVLMLIPSEVERHPDHEAVHKLARAAAFTAGLHKYITTHNGEEQQPHRPHRMLCYQQHADFSRLPDLYIDISDTFDSKMASIRAFASQFQDPNEPKTTEPQTFISRPAFLEGIEARARYYGDRIGTKYAEAFLSIEPLGLTSLSQLL
jgi:N-acetylglucosamine malate deacetylase 1